MPNVLDAAINCQRFGAEGITVHPRPDERHIRYQDVRDIRPIIATELNIEGYPNRSLLNLALEVKAHQVTLVPDPPEAITSSAGWDAIKHQAFLKEVIAELKAAGIRTSIFVETDLDNMEAAAATGTDRVELYTEPYAHNYSRDPEAAVAPFRQAAIKAHQLGMGINAGHDLNLDNLRFFNEQVPNLDEVSIGHALIADALYLGLENTVQMYLSLLR